MEISIWLSCFCTITKYSKVHFMPTKSSQKQQKTTRKSPENVEKYTFSLTFCPFCAKMNNGHKE